MWKKFEICSASYDIALNQDEDDVFRTGCAHLYHFLHGNGNHGRSEECRPMTLKMHLELNELIEETEEQIVEPSNSNNAERPFIQQLEAKFQSLEDSIQANNADAVNKLMQLMEKLENNLSNIVTKETDVDNNTIDHETNNALLKSSKKSARQSIQQLEKEVKDLEDRLEKLELNKTVNETADTGNHTIHVNSTEKLQQLPNKDNSNENPLNNGNNGSDNHKEYQTTPKENKEIQFDKDNLAIIRNIKSSDSRLKTAIANVIKLAKKMDVSLTRKQIEHIDVTITSENTLDYHVFFHTKTIKEAFLEYSDMFGEKPYDLVIWNESHYDSVYIRNLNSSDLDKCANDIFIRLAKLMGITLTPDQLYWGDVFKVNQNCVVCCADFNTPQLKDEFLNKRHILKGLPETKSLEIY